jgi:hypothetical protein
VHRPRGQQTWHGAVSGDAPAYARYSGPNAEGVLWGHCRALKAFIPSYPLPQVEALLGVSFKGKPGRPRRSPGGAPTGTTGAPAAVAAVAEEQEESQEQEEVVVDESDAS